MLSEWFDCGLCGGFDSLVDSWLSSLSNLRLELLGEKGYWVDSWWVNSYVRVGFKARLDLSSLDVTSFAFIKLDSTCFDSA